MTSKKATKDKKALKAVKPQKEPKEAIPNEISNHTENQEIV